MRPATKSAPDHLTVFREFLAHLGRVQHKAPAKRAARPTSSKAPKPARRKPGGGGRLSGLFLRHCEERSDEAIQPMPAAHSDWIASLRSQ